jgi:uncharacterized YceG family protein
LPRGNRPRPNERTAEERERARAERSRRRASAPDMNPYAHELPQPEVEAPAPPPEPPGANSAGVEHAPVAHDDGLPELDGAPLQRPQQPRLHGTRGGAHAGLRLTRARVGALLALACALALVWFLVSLFQPFAGAGSARVIVDIPKGASSSRIGSILARRGVVSSGFFFDLRALLEGKRGDLHSGRFQLRHNMSYAAAIAALSKPPPAFIAVKVVIPEGYTRQQIAARASEQELTGSYLAASKRSPLLDATRYGAPAGTRDLEGFLFPATYELSAGDPAAKLVAQQLTAFQQAFGSTEVGRARGLHLTPYQLLIVASMIEREAEIARDRPLIAAVIYNRLRRGMPLAIDATIYYALALRGGIAAYRHELTASELSVPSAYNTRIHAGLPPTPIANPGSASIDAAARPARVSYLYYVAGADGCGEHVFSTTSAQFQANAAAYQAALRRNGGRLPSCKRK